MQISSWISSFAAVLIVVATSASSQAQAPAAAQSSDSGAAGAQQNGPHASNIQLTGFEFLGLSKSHAGSNGPGSYPQQCGPAGCSNCHDDDCLIRNPDYNGACARGRTYDDAGGDVIRKVHGCVHHVAETVCCKLGYFSHQGSCGKGTPLFDCYHMVYAVNPEYFDPRDGRVYAGQDTGIPMAVPTAPTVNYTYNYGWGIPSSRMTPISRFYPEHGYIGQ